MDMVFITCQHCPDIKVLENLAQNCGNGNEKYTHPTHHNTEFSLEKIKDQKTFREAMKQYRNAQMTVVVIVSMVVRGQKSIF